MWTPAMTVLSPRVLMPKRRTSGNQKRTRGVVKTPTFKGEEDGEGAMTVLPPRVLTPKRKTSRSQKRTRGVVKIPNLGTE